MKQNDIWEKYKGRKIMSSNNYSIIYKAKDKSNNIDVIIKEIDLKKYSEHQSFNIKNLNQIKTENTVNIIDSYKIDDKYYIIMEKCENLESYVKRKPFSPEEIRKLLNQINGTLKLIKANKIIYYNLNLNNILVSEENTFKLSDFNLNKSEIFQNNCPTPTIESKPFQNNCLSIAPEILKNNNYNEKSDIWSLGVIIYYLLFKKYPYEGNSEFALLRDINSKKNLGLDQIKNNNLKDLINKMLKIKLEERLSWDEYFNHFFFFKEEMNNENEKNNEKDNRTNIFNSKKILIILIIILIIIISILITIILVFVLKKKNNNENEKENEYNKVVF